jgi:RNA polymerase sigma-70 factor, ECF subfamily
VPDVSDKGVRVLVAVTSRMGHEEPGSLERIFIDHHARVWKAAYRITGNAADAEDVLQSVFLRLTHRGDTALPADNLASYLYRTAVNAALDLLRSRRSRVNVELSEAEGWRDSPLTPHEVEEAREIRSRLRQALAALPPRAAEVFALRYLEGYDNHEIAGMLGISRVTVAVILHRTRHRLQKNFRAMRSGR